MGVGRKRKFGLWSGILCGRCGLNTKQVEELTGMSRQNIRYYERQGLLEPAREDGNAYRDYSGEDVRRLKLIKMLRMLDMPLKEIENVINGTVSIQEAAARQQEELEQRQRQLHAAISVCGSLQKEKDGKVDVDGYLDKMEKMSGAEGGFARFMDDYKRWSWKSGRRCFPSMQTDRSTHPLCLSGN